MKNLLVLILTMSIGLCQAQNRDPEAQKLLDQVSAKVNGYDNMVLEFKYVLDNSEENIHQETRGDVTSGRRQLSVEHPRNYKNL